MSDLVKEAKECLERSDQRNHRLKLAGRTGEAIWQEHEAYLIVRLVDALEEAERGLGQASTALKHCQKALDEVYPHMAGHVIAHQNLGHPEAEKISAKYADVIFDANRVARETLTDLKVDHG